MKLTKIYSKMIFFIINKIRILCILIMILDLKLKARLVLDNQDILRNMNFLKNLLTIKKCLSRLIYTSYYYYLWFVLG